MSYLNIQMNGNKLFRKNRIIEKMLLIALVSCMSKQKATFSANSAIDGWADLIGGLSLQMAWQSPTILNALPLTQTTAFAPRTTVGPSMNMMGVSVGVTISATF